MRFDVRGVDHLRIGGPPTPGQLAEQVLPQPAPRPAHEAVIDCRRRAILGWAIAPAAAALENMHDPADDPAIVNPLHTSVGKCRAIRAHCSSLSQNKFLRMIPIPSKNESESYCQRRKLMSFDPSLSSLQAAAR
jgi:hypothetical protein